jgi:hypothetical protein
MAETVERGQKRGELGRSDDEPEDVQTHLN